MNKEFSSVSGTYTQQKSNTCLDYRKEFQGMNVSHPVEFKIIRLPI